MTTREIKVHAFASTKGGVGKSTLAVTAARWIARNHTPRVPVVVDLDLTGSSLADGLALVAPDLPIDEDGRFEATATSRGWLNVTATLERRYARSLRSSGSPFVQLPYSNDALLAREKTRVRDWLWRDTSFPEVRYLPASSIRADVQRSTRVLVEVPGAEWRDSLICSLREIVEGDPTTTDLILDLPPGTWGFAHATLAALHLLGGATEEGILWSVNVILVTSPDKNALVPTLEYFAANEARFRPRLLAVVNRALEAPEVIRRRAKGALAGPLALLGHEELLVFLDESPSLGAVFRGTSAVEADPDLAARLRLA